MNRVKAPASFFLGAAALGLFASAPGSDTATANSVRPARITSPSRSRTGRAWRAASCAAWPFARWPAAIPLTKVPFLLPRSRSSQSGGLISSRK
ncbi:MAG: hypothetical protein NTX64_14960 [Elusimicrobia bacterium]|nr:hypothetical protein [Elusimicrobiota bacterium]